MSPTSRAIATAQCRQAILDAALACCVQQGVTEATLATIRTRAHVSTAFLMYLFRTQFLQVLLGPQIGSTACLYTRCRSD